MTKEEKISEIKRLIDYSNRMIRNDFRLTEDSQKRAIASCMRILERRVIELE